MRKLASLLAVGLLATSCSSDAVQDGFDAVLPSGLPFDIQRCPAEAIRVSAPEEFYRDGPVVYEGNSQPIEELTAWARTKPGFQDRWIDRDHNGWVTLAFSEGARERQSDLERKFPGVGVVAVSVPWTDAELQSLRDDVFAALRASDLDNYSSGHSVSTGLVEVSVPVLDEAHLRPLAPFAHDGLCVSGADPVDAIPKGPQPTEGEGWRLLGTERTGAAYRTGVATTEQQYELLWDSAGLTTEQPSVDFASEVVIWFGAVYGSGCEIRMDDVVFDQEQQLVHGSFVLPGSPVSCNGDANPEAYVVAVERSALPAAPFAIQLRAADPPAGVPEERTLVAVDLQGEFSRTDR